MTDEHVIPSVLGGRLVVPFLCQKCNSNLGSCVDASARKDPMIQRSANKLRNEIPLIAEAVLESQKVIASGPSGENIGYLKGEEFVVKKKKNENDNSLIQPTSETRKMIKANLEKQGCDPDFVNESLRNFDEAPENTRIKISSGLEVIKWENTHLKLALADPEINSLFPIKIAYEFLAICLVQDIYQDRASLNEIRQILSGGEMDLENISVERLHAPKYLSLHGIIFEGNEPYAKVLIRLFGKLAFRVHFHRLAINSTKWMYTHYLANNDESFSEYNA
jgi:hypothetical protein